MNTILVLTADAEDYLTKLMQQALPEAEIIAARDPEQAQGTLERCNVILGAPPMVAQVLHQAPRLEWVQSTFAGVDRLCQAGLRRDYRLTGVKGVFGHLMSEYVFAYILAQERRLRQTWHNQVQKQWQPLPYRRLQDLTLGLCGLGSIGRHIATTASHFGMKVTAYRRSNRSDPLVDQLFYGDQLSRFLAQPDYLVLALPSTGATRHLINKNTLEAMKPDATLINVGRGDAVDETALIQAVDNGSIAGAVLDVFEEEPLPPQSPLWNRPNVVVTPHNAARSFPEDIVAIFSRNYQHFLAGEPLEYQIDFENGY